jgi:hypothetical protein
MSSNWGYRPPPAERRSFVAVAIVCIVVAAPIAALVWLALTFKL